MEYKIPEEILEKVRKSLGNFTIIEKKEGYSNEIFILKTDNKKYVLKIAKEPKSMPEPYGLFNEYVVLKFLESKNIDFVPRAVFYSRNPEFEIQTYVGERNISMKILSPKNVYYIYRMLAEVAKLNVKDYVEFAKKYNLTVEEPETIVEIFERYGIKRSEEIKNFLPAEVRSFLEKKIKEVLERINWVSSVLSYIHLTHGDPTGGMSELEKMTSYIS